jgi:hypothetical protein
MAWRGGDEMLARGLGLNHAAGCPHPNRAGIDARELARGAVVHTGGVWVAHDDDTV